MTSVLKAQLVPRPTKELRWRLSRMSKGLGQISGQMCSTKALMPWVGVEEEVINDKTKVGMSSKFLKILKSII